MGLYNSCIIYTLISTTNKQGKKNEEEKNSLVFGLDTADARCGRVRVIPGKNGNSSGFV